MGRSLPGIESGRLPPTGCAGCPPGGAIVTMEGGTENAYNSSVKVSCNDLSAPDAGGDDIRILHRKEIS